MENTFLSVLQLIGGTFLLFTTGACFIVVLQWLLRKKFDLWEFLSLSILASFLVPPLILNIEFTLLNNTFIWQPYINSLCLFGLAGFLLFFKLTSLPTFLFSRPFFFLSHPLLLSLAFGSFFILVQVLSFSPLPDLDPYKWLYKYTYQFENHLLDFAERPLFGSFIFTVTAFTGITIFEFFKYFLPFLFLTILIPGWLIAKNYSDTRKQWLFLLFIFSIPNIVLYAGTAMPQAPLILISYFFVLLLIYSYLKQDDFYLYIAGISMLLAFFYHQTALLLLPAWILPVLIAKRKILFTNKIVLFSSITLLLVSFPLTKPLYDFGAHWFYKITPAFLEKAHFNWFYPAQYSNIDRNIMGWTSWPGIIKFYAYYVGPVLGIILLYFLVLLFNKRFRLFAVEKLSRSPALSVLLLSFLTFFIIAEVFPRFPGIALLPDRAWVFAGIFGYLFFFLLLQYFSKISLNTTLLFTSLFIVALGGTLYINYLKRYLISPLQLQSAVWIQNSLPPDRLFLSYGYRSLLPIHAKSPVVNIPNELYCLPDLQTFEKTITAMETSKKIPVIFPLSTIPVLSAPVANKYIYTITPIATLKENSIYIYYSQVHAKNPYRDRPYGMKSWGIKPCPGGKFLFDQYPQRFKRVYHQNDKYDEVIIWKMYENN